MTALAASTAYRRLESTAPATRPVRVALVGNPNSGKSTLFNALTGRRQPVANYPGVTVERVEGSYDREGSVVTVIDLPGTYSLTADSLDESIAIDVLRGRARGVAPVDVVVVVLDAENLERHLFLATQVLELGLPAVLVLNRSDRLATAGMSIDVVELIHTFGAVVVPAVSTTGEGVERIRHAISRAASLPTSWLSERPLDDAGGPAARYRWIASVIARTVTRAPRTGRPMSDRVDAALLHRTWGPLIFLAVMALAFQSLFTIARPLADGMQAILDAGATGLRVVLAPGELQGLLVNGIIGGVGSVLVFVPQIAILFLVIGVLEDSGYLARAAFVMDRFTRPLGLQGKSVIPLLSGYACAVPAILATRTIQHTRERLTTIMVVPLMSCSARLPVYALLIAAFVPAVSIGGFFTLQGLTLLAMYLLGTLAALASAWLFRRTILRSTTRSLIIELPPYTLPSARVLAATVWRRIAVFLRRAGTVIFSISVLLWALESYPRGPEGVTSEARLAQSAIGRMGHRVEPIVRPLGLDWKSGVAMMSSFAAREVFVSTMATMYGVSHDAGSSPVLAARLRESRTATGGATYSLAAALALMAFYVFALMCTSTSAVTVRETGGGWRGVGWAALQFGYMFALAWISAFLVYRAGLAIGFGGVA